MNTQYSIGKAIMNIAFFHACYELKNKLAEKALQKCTAEEILAILQEIEQEENVK